VEDNSKSLSQFVVTVVFAVAAVVIVVVVVVVVYNYSIYVFIDLLRIGSIVLFFCVLGINPDPCRT